MNSEMTESELAFAAGQEARMSFASLVEECREEEKYGDDLRICRENLREAHRLLVAYAVPALAHLALYSDTEQARANNRASFDAVQAFVKGVVL